MRIDTLGNIKWSTWYYDSVNSQHILPKGNTINSIKETSRGTIICAFGYAYPETNTPFINYVAYLEFDSLGQVKMVQQWDNMTGYEIGGYSIEEGSNHYYLLSGNKAVFELDSNGVAVWKKKYTFSLSGVGTMTNNVFKVKMLRNGTLVAAGQAYEGNCWRNYQTLYWDAWWSPIAYAFGTNSSWDTAGVQGRNDKLTDFCQLNDGRLVFVGQKTNTFGGLWAFVTDSTGKNLLWEKQFQITYLTAPKAALLGLSVCAADSGFTVAGEYPAQAAIGGKNAFVAKFIPAAPTTVIKPRIADNAAIHSFNVRIAGNRLLVSSTVPVDKVGLYTLSGKQIMLRTISSDNNFKSFDISTLSRGSYLILTKTKQGIKSAKIVLDK
jgi:hypothetical protein